MNEKKIEAIVKQSEVTTSDDFTDNLIAKIEASAQPKVSIGLWKLTKIILGFAGVAFGIFILGSLALPEAISGNPIVPVAIALFLLLGLNHVLTLQKYQSYLRVQTQ